MNRIPRATGRVRPVLAVLLGLFATTLNAQLPASVDIDLATSGNEDTLLVRLRANGAGFGELLTGLTFTVRWPATSASDVQITGNICPSAIPASLMPTTTDGAWKYATVNAFGLSLLQDECPGVGLQNGTWLTILELGITGPGVCTPFNIVNDDWTDASNRSYYLSLNGQERIGSIEPAPADGGNCIVDCLGVVGGPALPGSSCDDLDDCTAGDVWTSGCACTGVFQDQDGDTVCDTQDGCPLDPLKSAPGICGCGTPDTDSDSDGTADCTDGCPNDPLKVSPGVCGCGQLEAGSACDDGNIATIDDVVLPDCTCAGTLVDCDDEDECTADSYDGAECRNEPLPDGDADGVCDLIDGCPSDPGKTDPGVCGCGIPDLDSDADGSLDCEDACPLVFGIPGSPCEDGDPLTVDDRVQSDCTCAGTPINSSCAGATLLEVNAPADCPANAVLADNGTAAISANGPTCSSTGTADLWYTFNAGTHASVNIALLTGSASSIGIAISNACTGTELYCDTEVDAAFDFPVQPGEDYFLRTFTDTSAAETGTFSICVSSSISSKVEEVGSHAWSVHPNPSEGVIWIRLEQGIPELRIDLMDACGRIVRSFNKVSGASGLIELDLGFVTPGTYMLNLAGDHAHQRTRLVVQ